ncbi:tetratricopeptide repeat protein [candidate division GN15 bacterium]|nr:tetratricopeptide repeat protein [candidate division GN15 bacterium]
MYCSSRVCYSGISATTASPPPSSMWRHGNTDVWAWIVASRKPFRLWNNCRSNWTAESGCAPTARSRAFHRIRSRIRGCTSMYAHTPQDKDQDWVNTIERLMQLARDAGTAYDYARALDYLTTVEEIWDSKGLPEFSLDLRFELHREKGKALASQGNLDHAIKEYQKILNYCRDTRHLSVKSETFTQIGQLLGKQGDHDRALGYHQRAINACKRLDDTTGWCKALRNLGVTYIELGEFEEAESTYKNAVALAGKLGDRRLYADLINNLGAIMNMKGNWERSLKLYEESLAIYIEEGEVRKSAYTKNNIGITLAERGRNDDAFTHFKDAYATATQIKDSALTLIVDINLADLYLKRRDITNARLHCMKADDYLEKHNLVNGNLVEVRKLDGLITAAEGNDERAIDVLSEALELALDIGARYLEAEVLYDRGTLMKRLGRHFDALNDLESSYHIYTTLKADSKREQTEANIDSIEGLYLEIFESMANEVDRKDKYTKGHSDRVASLSLLLAKELGLRSNLVKTVVAGALLHDIGKLRIDDEILKKPGRLTDDEFAEIKKHAEYGVEVIRDKEFPWDLRPLILHHHEHYDGNGYPLGLRGEDIPLGARIVCIADVFDALTSDRVYRKAFAPKKALEIMEEESGTTFDPVMLKCFARMINRGRADLVINSRTSEDEMYGIWSQCMHDGSAPGDEHSSDMAAPESADPRPTKTPSSI